MVTTPDIADPPPAAMPVEISPQPSQNYWDRLTSLPYLPTGSPYDYMAYGGGYGYGNYGYFPFFLLEQCRYMPSAPGCTHGTLKIDGPEMRDVDLYIDGYNYGVTSKRNSAWNKGYSIPAGKHKMQLVRKRDRIVIYEDMIALQSNVENGGSPQYYRVDKNRFKNEPDRILLEPRTRQQTVEEWRKQP